MEFREWILVEVSTADFLKSQDPETIKQYKITLKPHLSAVLAGQSLEIALNYFTYLYLSERVKLQEVPVVFQEDWGQYGDYITTVLRQDKSKLATTVTRQELNAANIQYHRRLQITGNKRKGPVGNPVVNVDQALQQLKIGRKDYLPEAWKGWQWVSLGCGTSSEEAAAGGHCGNSGAKAGDNIISLRDPNGRVHLTFIVNVRTGALGEAKAQNNQKPAPAYHPAIVALLLSGYVKKYSGGGYEVADQGIENFDIKDLDPAIQEMVQKHFGALDVHKIPDNYLPLSWIGQWSQERVDAFSAKEKIDFFMAVLRILKNHKPLQNYEYDGDERIDRPYGQVDFKFDLDKLANEIMPYLKNKAALEALGELHSLFADNQINSIEDADKLHPQWTGKLNDLKIIDTLNIKEETVHRLAKMMMEKASSLSIRDRSGLIDDLSDIGYWEDPKDWTKHHNIFDKEIAALQKSILDEVVEKGVVPDVAATQIEYMISNDPTIRDIKNFIWMQWTKDRKKVTANFSLAEGLNKEQQNQGYEVIDNAERELKPILIKNGYSPFIGRKEYNFSSPVFTLIGKEVIAMLSKRLTAEYRRKIKILNSESRSPSCNLFLDSIPVLKEFRDTGRISEWETLSRKISEYRMLYYEKMLKNVKKLILDNMQSLIQQANHPQEHNRKTDKMEELPRVHTRRHHESFANWLKHR